MDTYVIGLSLAICLTIGSLFFLKYSEQKTSKNKRKKIDLETLLLSITEDANKNKFEEVRQTLLSNKDYSASYLLLAAIKKTIYFNLPISFSNLTHIATELNQSVSFADLKYLLLYSQNESSWGISTILVRMISQNAEGEDFLKEQFENSFNLKRTKESLIVFGGLSKKLREVFIEKYYKKIMICCMLEPSYFKEGVKVYQEKRTTNIKESIYHDGYFALLLAKKKEIQKVNQLIERYFSSKNPEVLINIHLVYYFYARCLFECGYFKDSLHYFGLANKKSKSFEDIDHYISQLNNMGYSFESYNRNYSKSEKEYYSKTDNKSDRTYNRSNITPKIRRSYDPFAVLQVTATATKEELKKAYRQQMIQYHPDKVASMGKKFEDIANEKTKEINQAYQECLKIIGED